MTERKENYIDYEVGDDLGIGRITNIFSAGNNFIFYEADNSGDVSYEVRGFPENWKAPLNPKIVEIHALLPNYKYRKRYANRIASAFQDCLFNNEAAAIQLLDKIKETIIYSFKLRARLCYLISSLVFVVINLIIAILLNFVFKSYVPNPIILLFNIATFGSFGGFLSISFNFRKIVIDYEENFYIPILTGISRIFISMISSIIIFSIIRSELILALINKTNSYYLFYAVGALSGFSESFVPNVLKSIDKEDSK